MNYIILIALLAIKSERKSYPSYRMADTTLVGRIIETDSIFSNSNYQYHGINYYYGVHHIKIAVIDISDSNKISDTLILAYVYNKLTESHIYQRNFNLKTGDNYIFYVHPFKPCQSDFPRIQGYCLDGINFYPESNKLIKTYQSINRVIFITQYLPQSQR